MRRKRLVFAGTALNEAKNLEELYARCAAVGDILKKKYARSFVLEWSIAIVDNGSTDGTEQVVRDLCRRSGRVVAVKNDKTYKVDDSIRIVLEQAKDFDYTVLLCTDLQDPPEVAEEMFDLLLSSQSCDAVLGVKSVQNENTAKVFSRRLYYKLIGYSSRRKRVPYGYHGYSLSTQDVILRTITIFDATEQSARQCFVDACSKPISLRYQYGKRKHGSSSYGITGYIREAVRTIAAGDASTSRLSWMLASTGLTLSLVGIIFILANYITGRSEYVAGTPTLMAIVLISFSMQMLVLSLLSMQVEGIRNKTNRTKASYRILGESDNES